MNHQLPSSPPIPRLVQELGITQSLAAKISQILNGQVALAHLPDFPAAERWLRDRAWMLGGIEHTPAAEIALAMACECLRQDVELASITCRNGQTACILAVMDDPDTPTIALVSGRWRITRQCELEEAAQRNLIAA